MFVYPPQLIISMLNAEIDAKNAASKPAFLFLQILLDIRYAGKTIMELKNVAVINLALTIGIPVKRIKTDTKK